MKIVVVVIFLFLLLGSIVSVHAGWVVDEAKLIGNISPYEINPDGTGLLWITDYGLIETDDEGKITQEIPGVIWSVNPNTRQYTSYSIDYRAIYPLRETNLGHPVDARTANNILWWADGDTNFIGRADLTDGEYTLWEIPDADWFYGTAIDDQGRLWVSDAIQNKILSLVVDSDIPSGNVCTYDLPANSNTYYFAIKGNYLWLGDYGNHALIRVSIDGENFATSTWGLPQFSMPFGLALDGDGHLWYADINFSVLRELNPDAVPNTLKTYTLPEDRIPAMLTVVDGRIWYTGDDNSVGVLDPSMAVPTTETVTPASGNLMKTCKPITPVPTSEPSYLSSVSGSIGWNQTPYPTLVDVNGWKIFSMPIGSVPWGITFQDGNIYVVDNGRQTLVRLPVSPNTTRDVFLPLITR